MAGVRFNKGRMAFRTTIPVRFGDVDHAGIVYYPRFYIYFHEAFEDLFNQAGHSYFKMLDGDRIGFPTVHVETDFKAPLRYGDSLDIDLVVTHYSIGDAPKAAPRPARARSRPTAAGRTKKAGRRSR